MKTLLLVDLSGIFWANYHATKDQAVSEAFELTLGKVTQLRQGFDHVAIACDYPPYKRKEIAPSYKANREAAPPQAVELLRRVEARLEADGLLVWKAKGYEADDILATAVHLANAAPRMKITVASGDKDLLQVVDDVLEITVLSPQSGTRYDSVEVTRKFGVPPALMRDFLALVGDKSDGVAGVPGIGPVKAVALLKHFGTVEDILEASEESLREVVGKLATNVTLARDDIRLALRLIALDTTAPINFDDVFAEREPKKLEAVPEDFDRDDDEVLPPVKPTSGAQNAMQDLKETALAKVEQPQALSLVTAPASYELALQPTSINAVFKLATGLYNSRLYTKFPTPEAIMAVILRGREMGLSALTACDAFHVVEGKPAMHAHLIIARAKAHPECDYFRFVAGDDTFAEYETKNRRNPEPTRLRYTIDQARRAGMVRDRGNWSTRAAEMLRKTCAVQLARIEYPDASLGLYAIEELGDEAA